MPFKKLFFSGVLTALLQVSVAQAQSQTKTKVLLIGTGGTIAGEARVVGGATYDSGKLAVEALLETIPEVKDEFELEGRQLADPESATADNPAGAVNVNSSFIRERHWLILARWIQEALEGDRFDAVIVTHGTDTLEETAFFLQLTVKSSKPVFVVGAMRPSRNNADPDGPDNLRGAFRLALDNRSRNKGVLVVAQFRVFPAYDVTKVRTYPSNLPIKSEDLPVPFDAPNFGSLASIQKTGRTLKDWRITWNDRNRLLQEDRKALELKFDAAKLVSLPEVPVLSQEVGNQAKELIRDYYLQQKPEIRSFVLMGSGNCALTRETRDYIAALASRPDLVFVRSSHTASTHCHLKREDLWPNVLGAATLNPRHFKILLQLFQAAFDSDRKERETFRDALTAYLRERVPYPYGLLPD
ncbi:MAG TPA: asparaginase domain-containing protein [Terriglobia bacterium]|nr:asparaginase domain-containing protein [Terriglobia bacterium]